MTSITQILTTEQIQQTQEEAIAFAASRTDRQILTMMATLNAYAWRAAIDYGAIKADESGHTTIQYENWKKLLNASARGEIKIMVAVKYLATYIKRFWRGAFHTRPTMMTYSEHLVSFGLFAYDRDRPRHTVLPPELEGVDFCKMLIIYRVLDGILRERVARKNNYSEDAAMEFLPKHGGISMRIMYDALFAGSSDFQGNYQEEKKNIAIAFAETAPLPPIQWNYPKFTTLCRRAWHKLLRKSGYFNGWEQQLELCTT